jgi:hypothetical protein
MQAQKKRVRILFMSFMEQSLSKKLACTWNTRIALSDVCFVALSLETG